MIYNIPVTAARAVDREFVYIICVLLPALFFFCFFFSSSSLLYQILLDFIRFYYKKYRFFTSGSRLGVSGSVGSGGSGERCGAELALQRRKRSIRVDIDLGKISEEIWPSFTAVSFHNLTCRGTSFAIGAQMLAYPWGSFFFKRTLLVRQF